MAEPKPRPTAEELEELVELVRRDPASPAFVDLGEAYLALGRAREAVDVGNAGLRHTADNHEGRLMVARGHAALHQWKEAQAELLRIVKVDRTNRAGFVLLGEVLMRRADYERAVPVLQHAQNLDPGSPQVLNLLRIARGGLPLDAPPPIPTPVAPRRAEARPRPEPGVPSPPSRAPAPPARAAPPKAPPPATSRRPAPEPIDDGPTTVGGNPMLGDRAMSADETEVRGERGDPTVPSSGLAWSGEEKTTERPAERTAAPPSRMPLAPSPARAHRPTGAPPDGAPVRPRVLPQAKPINAAAASLRQSAAVGETYLNDLLTGGLLDVPGVRVPDGDYDLRPDRRWGRSTTRAFIFLFVLLVLGVGGGGGWWYYSEQQKASAVAAHRTAARALIATGTWDGLTGSLDQLTQALKRDDKNTVTFAAFAESAALRVLLYGGPDQGVEEAIAGAAREIKKPGQPGYRELVIARTALALARLDGGEGPADRLLTARVEIDAWVTAHPEDRWAQWLAGRALLAGGQRTNAAAAFQRAGDPADGLAVAQIERADLLVDDGTFDQAMKLYDQALIKAPDHPLAVLGKSLARAERASDLPGAMDDLNVKLDKKLGTRTDAYRQLALALAYHGLERNVLMNEALAKATTVKEPRFLARVALARILQGRLPEAAIVQAEIKWYGKTKADPDPLVTLVNGATALAGGTPEAALEILSKLDGTRAQLLRGQALIDLGKYKDALAELELAFTAAPDSIEVQIWRQMAMTLTATGKARDDAATELERTSRKAKSKVGRHAHGLAMLLTGDAKEARRRLEQALDNVSEDEPNPLAYRTRVALATIERSEGRLEPAFQQLTEALKINPGYSPARIELAKVAVARGDGDYAAEILKPVLGESELATPAVKLLWAEALARRSTESKKDKEKQAMKAEAVTALQDAKAAGATPAELAVVAALIDPALAESMGLPAAEEDDAAKPTPKPKPRGRGRRGR